MSATVQTQLARDADFLGRTRELLSRSISRLSSGNRLVSASDDPAGNSLAEKLSAQKLRLAAASTNVQNAVSFVQSVDGFLSGMGNLLNRMSELAVLAKDPMKNAGDIELYQLEFQQLQTQIRNTIGGSTADIGGTQDISRPMGSFNGRELFGANPDGLAVATGQAATQRMIIPETNLREGPMLSIFQQDASGQFTLSVTDPAAVDTIVQSLAQIADHRATLGGVGSRLELVAKGITTERENLTSAISKITDIDVATESTRIARIGMLAEAATAMLTQGTKTQESVLRLLV
jgi:Flagellin and related hook-associated proteins